MVLLSLFKDQMEKAATARCHLRLHQVHSSILREVQAADSAQLHQVLLDDWSSGAGGSSVKADL